MKNLLLILLGGFVVFMLAAVTQEWDYFSSAWFGRGEATESLTDAQKQEAADSVRGLLAIVQHFLASGGDPRFAERMQASPGLVAEIQAEAEYLRNNGRRQQSVLQQFEVMEVVPLGLGSVEVRSREYWIHRYLSPDGTQEIEPPQSQKIHTRYLVIEQSEGWWVQAWEPWEGPAS